VVRAAGGTQISWVWCPADVEDSPHTLKSLYPGDSYVDWVGTDVYPRAGQSFSSAAQTEISSIRSVSSKPMMLPEIGYTQSDSASWWSNFLSNVLQNSYPYIHAVVIWEMPPSLAVVDSTTLAAFQQGIASSYYSSNNYSSLNISPIPAIGANPNSTPNPTAQQTSYLTPAPVKAPAVSPLGLAVDVTVILVIGAVVYVTIVRKQISSKKMRGRKKSDLKRK
jgi:hypothetical protein